MPKVSVDHAESVLQGILLGGLPVLWGGQYPIPLEGIPREGRRLLNRDTPVRIMSLGVPVVQELQDVWSSKTYVNQMS